MPAMLSSDVSKVISLNKLPRRRLLKGPRQRTRNDFLRQAANFAPPSRCECSRSAPHHAPRSGYTDKYGSIAKCGRAHPCDSQFLG